MNARALVADDDDLMRTFIVLALATVGVVDVAEAADGDDAVRLFDTQPFDLILIDWHMPSRSGLEVVRYIRAHGSQVPVIMVTAEAERGQVLDAIHAGASDYLVKPFEAGVLRAKIERLLASRSPV